jgi:hypothetical protein
MTKSVDRETPLPLGVPRWPRRQDGLVRAHAQGSLNRQNLVSYLVEVFVAFRAEMF